MRLILFASLVGLAVGGGASTAAAQTDDTALARSLFEQGVELADRGEWAEAADRFQRSLELRASPVVAYNLGSALAELGRLVAASEAFRRAIRAGDANLQAAATARLDAIQPRIGTVTIELEGSPEGAEVRIDGDPVPRQAIGMSTPIDPGEHTVDAWRSGQSVASASVTVAEGGSEEVTLQIPAAPTEPEPEEPDPVLGGNGPAEVDEGGGVASSPWLWIGIGAAVAAAVAIVLVVVLSDPGVADPVSGTLSPGFVEF